MKNLLFTIIAMLTVIVTVTAQVETVDGAPQAIRYQAIATTSGTPPAPVANQTIDVQMSVLTGDDPVSPTLEWEETHIVLTNADGLFEVRIGEGSKTGGRRANFFEIRWDSTAHFLKVELDDDGDGVFTDMGTTQFLSVPYSFSSSKAAYADSALYALSAGCHCSLQAAYNNGALINLTSGPVRIETNSTVGYSFLSRIYPGASGHAGIFVNEDVDNFSTTLRAYSAATHQFSGAGSFEMLNSQSIGHALQVYNAGSGAGLFSRTDGLTGTAGYFQNWHLMGTSPALQVETAGFGDALYSINYSTCSNCISARAGYFAIQGTENASIGIEMQNNGISHGVAGINNITNNIGSAILGISQGKSDLVGTASAVEAIQWGTQGAHAGRFWVLPNNDVPEGLLSVNYGTGISVGSQASEHNAFYGITFSSLNPAAHFWGIPRALECTGDVNIWGSEEQWGDKLIHGNVLIDNDLEALGFIGVNVKNCFVKNHLDEEKLMYSEESTESWFSDLGSGQLLNGEVVIEFDQEFMATVNLDINYHVFIQLEGLCAGGVIVTDKTATSFKIVHNGPGSAQQCDAVFSYEIKARRRGFENLRLPTTVEISAAAAQNLINFFPEKIAERDARIAVGNRMKQEADQKAQEMIQNTDRMRPDPSTFPQPESIPIVELPIPEEVE